MIWLRQGSIAIEPTIVGNHNEYRNNIEMKIEMNTEMNTEIKQKKGLPFPGLFKCFDA